MEIPHRRQDGEQSFAAKAECKTININVLKSIIEEKNDDFLNKKILENVITINEDKKKKKEKIKHYNPFCMLVIAFIMGMEGICGTLVDFRKRKQTRYGMRLISI